METGASTAPSFGNRFGEQLLRWWAWILAIGVGFQGGELLASPFFGLRAIEYATITFVTGVIGYVIFGAVIGAVIALILAGIIHSLPGKLRTWRVAGGITVVSLLLGILCAWARPQLAFGSEAVGSGITPVASACTSAAIARMFDDFKPLDANPNGATGAARADKLWRDYVDCDAQAGLSLSDRDHGIYIDVLVFGLADSAYAYYSVGRYHDSRQYLDRYRELSGDMRKIAETKGWHAFLQRLDTLAPILKELDDKLRAKGF